jgi:hypothetical protein
MAPQAIPGAMRMTPASLDNPEMFDDLPARLLYALCEALLAAAPQPEAVNSSEPPKSSFSGAETGADDAVCPSCDRITAIRHCQACGCDFTQPKPAEVETGAGDWNREAVEVLSNVADELDATGRHSQRIARLIESVPKPAEGGATSIVGWIFEDQLPEGYPYEAMFPHSKVDGVRMFPVFAPAGSGEAVGEVVESELDGHTIKFYRGWAETLDALEIGTNIYAGAAPADAEALEAELIALAKEREDGYRNREHGDLVNKRVADKLVDLARRLSGGEGL